MALIEIRNLTKTYQGGFKAVDQVNLEVEEGETLVLVGTSGSGKTTLLKMINRLIEPTAGEIRIRGRDVTGMNPIALRRDIGYVIQRIGLFPHMTIEDNIAIVPRLKGWPRERRREKASELLAMVGLDPDEYRSRFPAELSGGQQQRIGVARALADDPDIILMDEPFGALDPITREQLQEEFRQLKERIQKTIIFVTHDIFEAVNLADRMAIMDAGRILQVDAPERVLAHPADEFVARFLGKHRFHLQMSAVQVRDVMIEAPVTVQVSEGRQTVAQAAELMRMHRVTTLLAVDRQRKLLGVITTDAVRSSRREAGLQEVIAREAEAVSPDADLLSAIDTMANSHYSALPVVNGEGRVVGILTASSLTGVFAERLANNREAPREVNAAPTSATEREAEGDD